MVLQPDLPPTNSLSMERIPILFQADKSASGIRNHRPNACRNAILAIIGVTLLVPAFTGCKSQKKSTGEARIPESGFSAASLAESSNQFAIDLFRKIHPGSDNVVFSPYSVSTVMAMCYSGAAGETARQMSEVLYFPPAGQLEPASRDLRQGILSSDTLEGTEISLANAIWAQRDFDFLPQYLENITRWYDAPLTKMDFILLAEREQSRQKINQWVEEKTRLRIKDLIGPGILNENTRMVLTNAIYFNGKWKWTFDEQSTVPSLFHVGSSETRMVPFMNMTRTLPYYEDNEIQAIRLPYRDDRLSLTILLPRQADGWEMVSRVLDLDRLNRVDSQLKFTEVWISLPRFTLELKMNLRRELSSMGMDLAFGRYADFSGMTGEKNLFIDEVIHKAFIEVSERGTEAAAATAAIMSLKSALREEPVRFNADHPFLYYIRDEQTGCIIFFGRLVIPS